MTKILKLAREIATIAFVVWVASIVISYIRAPKLDSQTLPHIQAKLIDGSTFDSDKLDSRPLMIEFWGTWCPVCRQQSPNVSRVAKNHNVLTIAVNSGSNKKIQKWLKEHNVSFPVLNDVYGKWAERFKVSVYPTTFFYGSDGKLKFTDVGYTTTAGMLARLKMIQ